MSQENTTLDENLIEGYDYDGIKELDNPCPKWLMYIFYMTLFFAIFYLGFHIGRDTAQSNKPVDTMADLQKTKEKVEEPQVKFNESQLVAILNKPEAIAKGKDIFASKCASCHGPSGEGLIGPNLTDNYWLKGKGKITEIAEIVHNGIPDTGMASWKGRIPEEDILKVSAFVKTLKGSNPENAKEPEGELVEE